MGYEERQIEVAELETGMYVCRLDRSWEGTPFPLQGFLLQDEDQFAWLRAHCCSVHIDIERGRAPRERRRPDTVAPETLLGSVRHENSPFDAALPGARRAHETASQLAARILDDVRAGHKLAWNDVEAAAAPIVESVLRNADTLLWVHALQRRGAYAYGHAIHCSALAAAFGRHLGLPAALLVDLAAGGLLLDVGKARIDEGLLLHPGPLDAAQTQEVRGHVALGQRMLEDAGQHAPAVLDMLRTHHERWDGSGYPLGLQGTAIPLFGRMAGLVDSFDAMTSVRPYAKTLARHEALQEIYRARDSLYQGELVEQFIGCLGVYPTGSLVELSTGEVAVVMAQNTARRLRPLVMLLTGPDKRLRGGFLPLDLMAQPDDGPDCIRIAHPLPVGAFGLDPAELYL
ncbi:MAG TPA: HD-GYP domain-containing protein [Xanthomonadaceae bacterium]|nr:HD-GYP domain-containing protein [Xanthomonadaceae bacterium]